MTTISKAFSAVGAGGAFSVKHGDSISYSVTGTSQGVFDATLILQRSKDLQSWETVVTATADVASTSIIAEHPGLAAMSYRWYCSRYGGTSDPVTCVITEQFAATEDDALIRTISGTSGAPTIADRNKVLWCSSGSATTITLPADAADGLPVGFSFTVVQGGAGTVTIAAGSGASILSAGAAVAASAQYAAISVLKKAANTWYIAGSLA